MFNSLLGRSFDPGETETGLSSNRANSQLLNSFAQSTSSMNYLSPDINSGQIVNAYILGVINTQELKEIMTTGVPYDRNHPMINFGAGPVPYNGSTDPAAYGLKVGPSGIAETNKPAVVGFTSAMSGPVGTQVNNAIGGADLQGSSPSLQSTTSGTSMQGSQNASLPSFTRNLGPGQSGDDVKALQNWLISQGYQIPAGATGYYGDQTKNAVAAWQESIGLDTAGNPGYFGPRSMAALNMAVVGSNGAGTAPTSSSGTSSTADAGNTTKTGIPELDAILTTMEKYMADLIASGKMLNPNIELDPTTVQKFLEQATNEIDPYYAGQIKTIKDELQNNLAGLQQKYELQKKDAEATFKKTLAGARESYAGAGTIFSGQRNRGEGELVSAQDRALQLGGMNTADAASSAITSAAKQIGDRNLADLNIPGFSSYSATNAGEGGFSSANNLSIFRPTSPITGSLEREKTTSILTRKAELEKAERSRRALNFYS